jgi:hypothetical protein
MTLYDTIFKRRSVYKYKKTPLGEDVLAKIRDHIDGVEQLRGHSARFEIVTGKEVKGKAPYYIIAYFEEGTEALINIGYCLQSVDLYIQSLGLGSLWVDGGIPLNGDNDDCYIWMAFGNSKVKFHKGENDFKRLNMKDISNENNAVMRAARLAPSSDNSQPWYFTFGIGSVVITYRERNMINTKLKRMLNKVDLGIVLRHTELAFARYGEKVKDIAIINDENNLEIRVSY